MSSSRVIKVNGRSDAAAEPPPDEKPKGTVAIVDCTKKHRPKRPPPAVRKRRSHWKVIGR